ncbi:MAG: hypothetical protein J0H44_19465 [Alphaproteobacteria bacterium]|nr:hypothetical protein [Alphaproteobacteria bacterium]
MAPADGPVFCGDEDLGYLASRTRFKKNEGFAMDEAYRLAHLPLVAPDHPRVVARKAGSPYERGRHGPVISLVLPIASDDLLASENYRTLEADLKRSPFAHKIAWPIVEQRRGKLHATICGALEASPGMSADRREALAGLGPLFVELRGLFSGNVNQGRLYLRVYPEKRHGADVLRQIQRLMGRRETGLYVVGLYNLVDDLDAGEAAELARLVEAWWDRLILRCRIDRLWLLSSRDDLALDSEILETIGLG